MNFERYRLPLKYINNFPYPDYFIDQNVYDAIKWTPQEDDLIVATYPKCGTTWIQAIVWSLQHFGDWPMPRFNNMMIRETPFIECIGPKAADALRPPRHLKTHHPFHLTPYSPKAKYITIVREPKDVCVSYFHFCRQLFEINEVDVCTFDQFFEEFMLGEVPYGDYYDHILSWYAHKDDENVLFLVYEQMIKDHVGHILKIAKFVSSEKCNYEHLILKDNAKLLRQICENTTFDSMKKVPVNNPCEFTDPNNVGERGKLIDFFRKGVIGDWVNYFNAEQIRRIDQRTKEKFGDLVNTFGWKI
ncbi:sulfotransferase 1C2-like protein [Dinothrombium tinctorium]|uniref:Sulfotransferase 1C2-like protein n=1 Tax=Dinothrombium tinctorium TaxID=1965070 RepID=A0A3S4QRP8_9ACAR|nr:sulfotransferase 1C2-like protein [Dinothrombium tinctorium]